MKTLLIGCFALLITLAPRTVPWAAVSHRPAQNKAAVLLTVSGEVDRPLKLTASDIGALPRLTVRAKEHSGEEASFEGVALIEVMKAAGMKFGESMRGKALSTYFVIKASDGYQVIFTPPDLDPGFTDRVILLADKKNGAPPICRRGPVAYCCAGRETPGAVGPQRDLHLCSARRIADRVGRQLDSTTRPWALRNWMDDPRSSHGLIAAPGCVFPQYLIFAE